MSDRSVRIDGINEVRKALAALPAELRKSAETAVLRAGAGPILKGEKAHAPVSDSKLPLMPGLLRKSLGISIKTFKGRKSARVGARSGFATTDKNGKRQDPVKYAHFVELGTSHSAARPFIRPAIDSAASKTLATMAAGLDTHLTRVCAKLAKSA